MTSALKTSSIELDFAFDRAMDPILITGAHPLVVEIIELIELRMLSDDLVIDEDLFPDPQDYLDHAWLTCVGALEHHFPEVEFVRMGVDTTVPHEEGLP